MRRNASVAAASPSSTLRYRQTPSGGTLLSAAQRLLIAPSLPARLWLRVAEIGAEKFDNHSLKELEVELGWSWSW